MSDFAFKEQRQKALIIICSAFGSFVSLLIIHALSQHLTSYAIHFFSIIIQVINIYLFYQVFDLAQIRLHYRPKKQSSKFFIEFVKIVLAFFIAGVMNFYFISRPIFKINFDPNYLLIILVFSIPSAVIARIISELRQVKEVALQSRAAQAEAQYNLLEMQMQPHFLFNSLNVLSELIYVDPDMACSMTQQLADLYREILTNSKQKFSNLESEISILEKYIQIQKIRFGERIRFEIDVKKEYYDIAVPSLILQTLVENAIKHGISPRQDGGDIKLSVRPVDSKYEICISNTGELYQSKKKTNSQGTGLQNTKNRLDLFYGHSHNFRIYSEAGKTYVKFLVSQDVAHSTEVIQ